ncbi:hypothetical protein GPM19_15065 [Halomonas sp. ZH2S]|uniref:Mobilization protein n=1 Tax=Vreelandella zhuhanensis TaxID=2684210 RepID=A0A7X3H4W2_9GAMM|nr:hypothetical protein [Halomonas zhuhanensis]MWJ29500.1 hypothetical protein [Halomonas zhuhanensis]
MLVNFRGSSRKPPKNPLRAAKGATGYLLGNKDHKGQERAFKPVLLDGSPDAFEHIVGYGNQAGKYTSGGLYFEESREDLIKKFGSEKAVEEKLQEIMDGFEETLFPGLDKDQYCGVWILHEDKSNIELNFLFAKEEIRSGKSLTPYYHKADLTRVNTWKDIVNFENGFSDPNSPDKKRAFIPEFFNEYKPIDFNSEEAKRRDFKKELTEEIEVMALNGKLSDRNELIDYLEKEKSLEVSRQTKTAISVINPLTNKPARLKGALFEEKADYKQFSNDDYRKELMERYENERFKKIEAQREKYKEHMEHKKEQLKKQYNKEINYGQVYAGSDFKLYERTEEKDGEHRERKQDIEKRNEGIERRKPATKEKSRNSKVKKNKNLEQCKRSYEEARKDRERTFNRFFGENGVFGEIVNEVNKRLKGNLLMRMENFDKYKKIEKEVSMETSKSKTKKKSQKNDQGFSM